MIIIPTNPDDAEVAEQADASVSKTDEGNLVRVRLPLSAPIDAVYCGTCYAGRLRLKPS